MTPETQDLLGIGLYTPREAAFYARVSPQTINRWKFGDARTERVFTPEFELAEERIITFFEFIMALAIREIRIKYKLSLPTIREGIKESEERYGIPYPFAMKHTAYLLGKAIYIRKPGDVEDLYTRVTGRGKGQIALSKIIELYVQNLYFGPDDLAEYYSPFKWMYEEYTAHPKIKRIIMHPQRRFGEPIVESCGISAKTLYEASLTEEGIKEAADIFCVEPEDVDIACRYMDYLEPREKSAA